MRISMTMHTGMNLIRLKNDGRLSRVKKLSFDLRGWDMNRYKSLSNRY
jgi:hypothetical protein